MRDIENGVLYLFCSVRLSWGRIQPFTSTTNRPNRKFAFSHVVVNMSFMLNSSMSIMSTAKIAKCC